MSKINTIATGLEVVMQIVGFGEQMIGIKISIYIDLSITIKPTSDMIVKINLATDTEEVQVVQSISYNNIIDTEKNKYFDIEGILWMKGKLDIFEVISKSAEIWYIMEV